MLQMPPVDAGAKAACEAAVRRLINDRNQVMRSTGSVRLRFLAPPDQAGKHSVPKL